MGSGSSRRLKVAPCNATDERKSNATCAKHGNIPFIQYNEKDNELYCSSCFDNYRRRNIGNDTKHCVPIDQYIESLTYKQKVVRIEEELQYRKRVLENHQTNLKRSIQTVETQNNELFEEINSFVNTIVNLLQHIAEDLCKNVSEVIKQKLDVLSNMQIQVATELHRLDEIKELVDTGKNKRKDGGARLCSVIDSVNMIGELGPATRDMSQTAVVLTLYKSLRLEDISGTTSNLKLGEVNIVKHEIQSSSVDYSRRQSNTATLTGISETEEFDLERSYKNVQERSNQNGSKDNATTINAEYQTLQTPLQQRTANVPSINVTPAMMPSTEKRKQFRRDTSPALPTQRRMNYGATPTFSSATPSWRRSNNSKRTTSMSITTPSGIHVGKHEMIHRNIEKVDEFDISAGKHNATITDSVFLHDGSLVLCDSKNKCLYLFNPDFEFRDRISLESQPHNITVTSANEVAVSLPNANTICYVKIVSGWFLDEGFQKRFRTGAPCHGVASIQGSVLYTTENEVLEHKDNGNDLKFQYPFRDPVSLTADEEHGRLFVSCIGKQSIGEVVVMKTNGESEFTVPAGKVSHPVCCTLDRERNIYICDIDPYRILQVSPKGYHPSRVLMESQTEKYQHINFLPREDKFLLTSKDSNTVTVYEMV